MTRTIAIVGAGYGGASLAKELQYDADIVLIDPRDAFVNVAGSLRAIAQPEWAPNMFFPLDQVLTRGTLLRDRAVSVDAQGVALASGQRVEADYIVLATGSTYPYPANPIAESTAGAIEDFHRTHQQVAEADKVLIFGAGPVGLELAGEIKEVWPEKEITILDPADGLLPGFLPEVQTELLSQLDDLGITLLLGTRVTAAPTTEPGQRQPTTVRTTGGQHIAADIWFRAHGVTLNTDYLADRQLTERTSSGAVRVTSRLNVEGYEHVYAIGDITDMPEAKMAGYAGQHATTVAQNIRAQIAGAVPDAVYQPLGYPMVLLPLGTRTGVGQLPSPDGPIATSAEVVSEYKGADIFTARFAEQFGIAK